MLSFDSIFRGTGWGLGPTTDMEPNKTLKNCGISSRFVLRRNLPIGVIRESFLQACWYLPVIGKFFKSKTPDEDNRKRDQLLSFFVRLILPKEKAELYGELGRNDHSHDMRDFLLEPEHSRAYIIGFKKIFETGKETELQLMGEFANLKMSSTILLREQQSWYTHYQVRDGYTNYGQVIGAGIGPGGK